MTQDELQSDPKNRVQSVTRKPGNPSNLNESALQAFSTSYNLTKQSVTRAYHALKLFMDGKYQRQIADELNISKRQMSYLTKRLKQADLLVLDHKGSYNHYAVTWKGKDFLEALKQKQKTKQTSSYTQSSPGVRGRRPVRLHNYSVKYPVVSDEGRGVWDDEVKLRNWTKKLVRDLPVDVTVEKTSRNVILHFKQFRTEEPLFLTEFMNRVRRAELFVLNWLKGKMGVEIDLLGGVTVSQHIANEDRDFNRGVDPGATVSVGLGRDAVGVLPAGFGGRAWLDWSSGGGGKDVLDLETNDLLYEEKLLLMPETVDALGRHVVRQTVVMDGFAENIRQHLQVMRSMEETLRAIRDGLE